MISCFQTVISLLHHAVALSTCGKKVGATEHIVQKQDKDNTLSPIWGVISYVYPCFNFTLSLGCGKFFFFFFFSILHRVGEVGTERSADQVPQLRIKSGFTSTMTKNFRSFSGKGEPLSASSPTTLPLPFPQHLLLELLLCDSGCARLTVKKSHSLRKRFFSAWASLAESMRSS